MSDSNAFFERPILNSPYEAPTQHWELDEGERLEILTPLGLDPQPRPKGRAREAGHDFAS